MNKEINKQITKLTTLTILNVFAYFPIPWRLAELQEIWKGGIAISFLILFVDLSPILLASISLSSYTLQTERLSASAAFESLRLFFDLHKLGQREFPSAAVKYGALRSQEHYIRIQIFFFFFFDDILSALDAHVTRWICDNALNGELAQGRTRILVTYQADLCLSTVIYLVQLSKDTVECAAFAEGTHFKGSTTRSEPRPVMEEVKSIGSKKVDREDLQTNLQTKGDITRRFWCTSTTGNAKDQQNEFDGLPDLFCSQWRLETLDCRHCCHLYEPVPSCKPLVVANAIDGE